ncbi:hypothetical protein F4804DRAFT_330440 [Jackrogersella minutella]|nr:hypothetical protein F4804DRAFT_330440 [Jackrogersella minutella]
MAVVARDSPQVFLLFARLPIELRFKIWAYNLPGPRIVEIKCSTGPPLTPQQRQSDSRPTVWTSISPIPVNLHACRESRQEASKRYRLLFRSSPQTGGIFFDPLRDTLYFGRRRGIAAAETLFNMFLSLVQREELACVHRIAINEGLISHDSSDGRRNRAAQLTAEQILCQVHQYFTNLEQLTFVCDDRNPVYSSDAVFVEPRVKNRILERRIRKAISVVEGQQPQFRPSAWSVRVIAAEPSHPMYDQSILGYKGSRSSFFQEFQLPQIQKAMAKWQSATWT